MKGGEHNKKISLEGGEIVKFFNHKKNAQKFELMQKRLRGMWLRLKIKYEPLIIKTLKWLGVIGEISTACWVIKGLVKIIMWLLSLILF